MKQSNINLELQGSQKVLSSTVILLLHEILLLGQGCAHAGLELYLVLWEASALCAPDYYIHSLVKQTACGTLYHFDLVQGVWFLF